TAADTQRPVRRIALVRAGRMSLRWLEELRAHIFRWNVVTRRQARLEQEQRATRGRHALAAEVDAHLARARAHVDAVMRIACMAADVLVLLEPVVDAVPRERQRAGNGHQLWQRMLI